MHEPRPPLLIILSGPSGVGKDTVIGGLLQRVSGVHYVVTATTRASRPGEIPGTSYIFVSQEEFDRMLDRGELVAPAEVHGNWYGAPVEQIRDAFRSGEDALLKVDVQGAMQLRRRFPQAVYIFLAPPSFDDLAQRMRKRHTENPQELAKRLSDARYEMAQMPQYDYLVVNRNGDVTDAVESVECIIDAERLRINRQPLRV